MPDTTSPDTGTGDLPGTDTGTGTPLLPGTDTGSTDSLLLPGTDTGKPPAPEPVKKRGRPKKQDGAGAETEDYPRPVTYYWPQDGRTNLLSRAMWLTGPGVLSDTEDGEPRFTGAQESATPAAGCYTPAD